MARQLRITNSPPSTTKTPDTPTGGVPYKPAGDAEQLTSGMPSTSIPGGAPHGMSGTPYSPAADDPSQRTAGTPYTPTARGSSHTPAGTPHTPTLGGSPYPASAETTNHTPTSFHE
jgi:hypothetical protein